MNIELLISLFIRQPLTPDRLPYTDDMDDLYLKMAREQQVTYKEIYETLMKLRKQGKLPGKGRAKGPKPPRPEVKFNGEALSRLFREQKLSVDKLPYTPEMDGIFEGYKKLYPNEPIGYSVIYNFLLNLRKNPKVMTQCEAEMN